MKDVDKFLKDIEDYQKETKLAEQENSEFRRKTLDHYLKNLTFEFIKLQDSLNNSTNDRFKVSKANTEKYLAKYYLDLYSKSGVLLMPIFISSDVRISNGPRSRHIWPGYYIIPENVEYWPKELIKEGIPYI